MGKRRTRRPASPRASARGAPAAVRAPSIDEVERRIAGRDFDNAERIARQLVERNPNDVRATVLLAQALLELQRLDESAAFAQQAIAHEPSYARAHVMRGAALANLGREHSAIASLQRAVALGDDSPDVHNALGVALRHVGDFDDAIEHLCRATLIAPDWAMAHSSRGMPARSGERRVPHEPRTRSAEPGRPAFRLGRL